MTISAFRTPQLKFAFLWRFNDPIENDDYSLYLLIGIPFFSIALIRLKQK